MTAKKPNPARNASSGKRDFRKRSRTMTPVSAPRMSSVPPAGDAHAAATIWLAAGREKSLQRRHPWIFSGAIARVDGAPQNGQSVMVKSAEGEFLAWAAYNAASQISGRVWS